jgi:hypothetical protein
MRIAPYLFATLLLGSATAAPTRAHAQTVAKPLVSPGANRRAFALHEEAVALHAEPPRAADAARLHVASARLRGANDPQAVNCLAQAAHLYSYSNRPMAARKTMEQAAERALVMGDVARAARAYTEAAFLADKQGNESETWRLGSKAVLLANSPLLDGEQRSWVLSRISSKASLVGLIH